jgi:hypothetical protein
MFLFGEYGRFVSVEAAMVGRAVKEPDEAVTKE